MLNEKTDYVKVLTLERDLKKTLLSPKKASHFSSSRALRWLPCVPAKFALKSKKMSVDNAGRALSRVRSVRSLRGGLGIPFIRITSQLIILFCTSRT